MTEERTTSMGTGVMGSPSTSLPYGSSKVSSVDIGTQRGRLLVYSVEDWSARNRLLKARSLVKWVYISLLLYVPVSLLVLWLTGVAAEGGGPFILYTAFPVCGAIYLVILLIGLFVSYQMKLRTPMAGIYEKGVGLADGTFLPYITMFGVERVRGYGPLRSDQVVFHTGHVKRKGPVWFDPTPRLPFDFLRMDGLKAIINILEGDPTRGRPMRRAPELIIYGPGGAKSTSRPKG
jgi:hypothetical protein